jgi:acyl-CoA thioester hydrolase
MLEHQTTYRVIYGDTDKMGIAYYGNYLRWFEIGRTEMIRSWGLSYKSIEEKGVLLPVSEAYCKFLASAQYDDILIIKTVLDTSVKAGIKFNYEVCNQADKRLLTTGYTKHAFMDTQGKVIRPPGFFRELIKNNIQQNSQSPTSGQSL